MQLKDVTPIIKAILEERDKIPLIIDQERYISNPQPYHDGNFMRGGIRKALRVIEQAPVVDAAPVVHGRWILVSKGNFSPGGFEIEEKCSKCGRYVYRYEGQPQDNYCPNCGVRMDAKEAEHGQES